jgi:glycine cleavage system H protein
MATVDRFNFPDHLHYEPKDHLWVSVEDDGFRVGIDELGQETAGTIVHLTLARENQFLKKGEGFGLLEAGKFVGPLRMPFNGRILTVNRLVLGKPALINSDPYGQGWLILAEAEDPERALEGLVGGAEDIGRWLRGKVQEYRERGILPDEAN